MKDIFQKGIGNDFVPIEPPCSCDDLDMEEIYSRFDRFAKYQESLGADALPIEIWMTTVAVVGAHVRIHGNGIFYSLDERVLRRFKTSLDAMLPVLVALDAAECISMRSTGNGTWVFRFVPPPVPNIQKLD